MHAVAQEAHRSVCQAEVRTAGMQTVIVPLVARVARVSGAQFIGRWLIRVGVAGAARFAGGILIPKWVQFVTFGNSQDYIAIAIATDAKTSKQPAKDQIGTWRALAHHQGIAQAVVNVGHLDPGWTDTGRVLNWNKHAVHAGLLAGPGIHLVILGGKAPAGR